MRALVLVLVLVAAACGDNVRTIDLMPDAYVPDAPPDAPTPLPSCAGLGCVVPMCSAEGACTCQGQACSPTGIPLPDAD